MAGKVVLPALSNFPCTSVSNLTDTSNESNRMWRSRWGFTRSARLASALGF